MQERTTSLSWQNDEEAPTCNQCNDLFTLVKRRHHCRVCGRVFCDECTKRRILIPRDLIVFQHKQKLEFNIPHRCCYACSQNLLPLQGGLRATLSKANFETHISRDSPERYFNAPLSFSLEQEIKKASYTLYNCTVDNRVEGKDRIPRELLLNAAGLVFITMGKLGFLVSGRIGTGLVIARLNDGSWSAPSAIMMSGFGWGLQVGWELTDVILILNSSGAVGAFSSRAQVALGTELGVSLGPVGRSAGTDIHGGEMGASAAFSYAHSKGLFAGVSLEASVIASRPEVNRAFYGMDVRPSVLLSGAFPRPKGAEPLYEALSEVLADHDRDHDVEVYPTTDGISTGTSVRQAEKSKVNNRSADAASSSSQAYQNGFAGNWSYSNSSIVPGRSRGQHIQSLSSSVENMSHEHAHQNDAYKCDVEVAEFQFDEAALRDDGLTLDTHAPSRLQLQSRKFTPPGLSSFFTGHNYRNDERNSCHYDNDCLSGNSISIHDDDTLNLSGSIYGPSTEPLDLSCSRSQSHGQSQNQHVVENSHSSLLVSAPEQHYQDVYEEIRF